MKKYSIILIIMEILPIIASLTFKNTHMIFILSILCVVNIFIVTVLVIINFDKQVRALGQDKYKKYKEMYYSYNPFRLLKKDEIARLQALYSLPQTKNSVTVKQLLLLPIFVFANFVFTFISVAASLYIINFC